MPLTEKGQKIMGAMQDQYGAKEGKSVFYASKNKGTIKGVDAALTTQNPVGQTMVGTPPQAIAPDAMPLLTGANNDPVAEQLREMRMENMSRSFDQQPMITSPSATPPPTQQARIGILASRIRRL